MLEPGVTFLLMNISVHEFGVDIIVEGGDLWISPHDQRLLDCFHANQPIDLVFNGFFHDIKMFLKHLWIAEEYKGRYPQLKLHQVDHLFKIESIPFEERVIFLKWFLKLFGDRNHVLFPVEDHNINEILPTDHVDVRVLLEVLLSGNKNVWERKAFALVPFLWSVPVRG